MDIKFKKVISLLLCCVLLFGMLPVNAFATNENAMDSSAVENNATEEQPQKSTSAEVPAEPDVPSTEESTEAPVVEETPAEKLYKQLMAFETYEALRAFLDNMTAEQLEVMNQFTYEQTAALSERMKALQGDIAAPVSEDTGNDEGDSEEITGEDTVIPDEIQVVEKTGSDDAVNAQVPAEGQTVDVDALFTRLMAAATYEELDALMEAMTEEEYALMAQFSDEQNAALAARVNFLSEYDSGVLADLTIAQGDTGTHTITAGRWDYDCRVYQNNANVTNSAGITVSDNGGTVTISVSETTAPGDYEVKYGYSWHGFYEIGNFTFTVVTAPSGSGTTTGPAEEIKRMTYDKKAVANGDGTYELSLSVSGSVGSSTSKALVDVIFIVDNSNSMYESSAYMSKLKPAMKSLVNNISNTNGDKIDARYAIAMFGTNSEIRQNFANDATTRSSIDGIGNYSYNYGGTNYQAGIYQGKQLLNSRRDGATTVVVFVTDGLPTYRGAPNKTGGSGSGDRENYNISAAVSEISGMSCNYFYCIGIGKDFTDSSKTANQNMTKLTSAVNAGTTGIYAVSQGTASELEAVFNKITAQVSTFLCSNVTITDQLGQVGGELMVQITDPASVKITVQAGDETHGPAASVKLPVTEYNKTETTLTAQYNSDSSTLTLDFPDGYMLEPDYTYIISATIEPTEKAYEEYRKTGYTDVGGANTGTYSGQAGFFANESATITYTYSDGVETKTETKTYPQPVIQLEPGTLVINKKIVGLAAEQDTALTFPVTLTVPGKTAETQEIPFEWFADADGDGIYTFTMGGLYPNTAYSVTESGYELEHYNVATNVTGADQNEGIVASGTVAKNAMDTVTFTNTYTLAVTDVPVSKIWTDADNQDGKRPASITINLMNGDAQVASKTVTEADGWAWTFENVDKYDANGKVIAYTVTENAVDGYTTAITGSQAEGFVITNTHTPAVTSVRGAKTWQDNDNQDGKRPASITISLLANGQTVATKTVTAADNWAWTFENLPEYARGQKINYTIAEMTVDGYQTSINGYNVTNTHVPEKTDVRVSKVWNDADDQDGFRPESISVVLLANGTETGKTLVLSESNNWTGSFTALDKFANGKEVAYTVMEIPVAKYETSIAGSQSTGYTVTNSHTPEVVEVSGSKTWVDNNNQDGVRPESITINLLQNGNVIDTKTVTEADGWAWSFTNLPKYENGTLINYSVTETAVDGYTTAYNGYNVTNTHAPAKTSVTVTKAWSDNNDQDGIRPNDVTIELLANGTETGKTLVLSAGNHWTGSFTDLDKFAAGKEVVYTIEEVTVSGYATVIAGSQSTGYTVTNSHTPEVVEVSGSKTWNDNNNQDGARPESITINLLKNGEVTDTKTVNEADGWAWSFTDLPKYENHGTLIRYSITEDAVDGYSSEVNGYNVTNTHAPEKTSVTVSKSWKDNDDQDGIRPNDVTIELLADGEATGKTLVLSAGNHWTGSFTELDKFANGQVITYSVKEVDVEGYATVIAGSQSTGYTVTNSHTPAVVEVSGSKTWVDNNNQDGARPESITINLLKNGEVTDTKTVNEADGWAWSFTDLPKYENHGTLIRYSITEDAVDGYSSEVNGYNVTNTHAPEKTSVTVSKSWKDNDDQDGIRPNDVTIELLADGEATGKTLVLSAGNHWTGSFTELDKFANGQVITYSVKEVDVEGYATVIAGSQSTGYTVTNSHTPAVVEVSGSKTWVDNNNQDGARPESITINLLQNGNVIDTKTVTEADGWAWSFTNLPKYKKGTLINYSVTETAVDGYTTTYNDYNVTNTHAPAKTSVTVTKAWSDNNDQDGIRPNDVTIKLLADGKDSGKTLVLSEGNNWTGSFTDLDKFAAGKEVVYTIEEVAVEGYESVLTGDQNTGYKVTNSHNPETFGIEGAKTWDDKDNQDGKRPESITIRLLADGVEKEHVTVTEENEWSWSFTNLPKYRDHGVEILYTITEDAVDDYNTIIDGFNVTNKYTPQETSITVTKSWQDNNDQDGIRPKKITVNLLKNGKSFKSQDIDADDNWTYTFSNLDVYAKGEKIEYTIEEKAVDGYETVMTGNAVTGFTVTNSHTPAVVDLSGTKTWDDDNNRDGKRPDSITVRLKANGKEVAVATVTAEDKWSYEFTNLPKYEAGTEIVYTVTEDAVAEYTVQYNEKNLDITNKYTPGKTFVTVTKRWVDGQNHDGIRPGSVTVELYANGVKIDSMKLTAKNDWVGVFDGLYIYENGKAIEYTVKEKSVWGYNSTVTGSADKGYTVTNTHNIIPKTGDDSNLPLYTGLFGASFTAMAVLMFLAKPRKKGKYLR